MNMFTVIFVTGRGGPVVRRDPSFAASVGDAAEAAKWAVVNGKVPGAVGFEVQDRRNGAVLADWQRTE